jgi:putative ABC transport system ATP-binding protein
VRPPDTANIPSDPPIIEACCLRKHVTGPQGELIILRDVDLKVRAGEALAIMGASGTGKSTLLGLLAGLDTASGGVACLFGQDLGALNEDGRAALRANRVGFVFQSFQLLPSLTALENVMLPLELNGVSRHSERIARESLARVGLTERARHYPHQLSGGEQQRVAIARAFAPEPQVLFADEPTGNLDQATGRKIIELLFCLRDKQGVALVLVTHDAELTAWCDRRLRLTDGRLTEMATERAPRRSAHGRLSAT